MHSPVKINQKRETNLTSISEPPPSTKISYLYARSHESYLHDTEGQDYLEIKYDARTISFAVCDGVGQSFCGDLAARFLGHELVEWLEGQPTFKDEEKLADRITRYLKGHSFMLKSKKELNAYPLPDTLPLLVQMALEGQRQYGSETMFVCGKLTLPDADDPASKGQLVLCWLGDTQVRLFDRQGKWIGPDVQWHTKERWSMTKGVKGARWVHAQVFNDLKQIGRIIAHSDGLDKVAKQLHELVDDPARLQRVVNEIHDSPDSDDISLINIQLIDAQARQAATHVPEDTGRASGTNEKRSGKQAASHSTKTPPAKESQPRSNPKKKTEFLMPSSRF